MRHLSVKGVASRYMNESGDISVKNDILQGSGSVRNKLENEARHEISTRMADCIVYRWQVAYEQVWTHITVRVDLNPDPSIASIAPQRNTWENSIETMWSDNWETDASGELSCEFTFEVQWNTGNPHHSVRVRPGNGPTDKSNWYVNDPGSTAAHEYGHMIGHEDEYPDDACIGNRSPVNTGTIMDNNSANVPARLIEPYANRINRDLDPS